MLDDDEFKRVLSKRQFTIADFKEGFPPMLEEYERITGVRETNSNAIWHHQLSLYGPPCSYCGKPLRTPQAKLCGACMKPVA